MSRPFQVLFWTLVSVAPALAHPGHFHPDGVVRGLAHPLSGLDHILAMVAVGMIAAVLGGRALWGLPAAFVGAMSTAFALAIVGVGLPYAELGVSISVAVLGLVLLSVSRLPLAAAVVIAGASGAFHGYVHGLEIPASASGLGYALGFMAATIFLHGLGLSAALCLRLLGTQANARSVDAAGIAFAVVGGVLAAGSLF